MSIPNLSVTVCERSSYYALSFLWQQVHFETWCPIWNYNFSYISHYKVSFHCFYRKWNSGPSTGKNIQEWRLIPSADGMVIPACKNSVGAMYEITFHKKISMSLFQRRQRGRRWCICWNLSKRLKHGPSYSKETITQQSNSWFQRWFSSATSQKQRASTNAEAKPRKSFADNSSLK